MDSDGISHVGADGPNFDIYNLLAMDRSSISHLSAAQENFVDTDCADTL